MAPNFRDFCCTLGNGRYGWIAIEFYLSTFPVAVHFRFQQFSLFCYRPGRCNRVGHGSDLSMIELDWSGLGQDFQVTL